MVRLTSCMPSRLRPTRLDMEVWSLSTIPAGALTGSPSSSSEVKNANSSSGYTIMAYQYSGREASCTRVRLIMAKYPVFIV